MASAEITPTSILLQIGTSVAFWHALRMFSSSLIPGKLSHVSTEVSRELLSLGHCISNLIGASLGLALRGVLHDHHLPWFACLSIAYMFVDLGFILALPKRRLADNLMIFHHTAVVLWQACCFVDTRLLELFYYGSFFEITSLVYNIECVSRAALRKDIANKIRPFHRMLFIVIRPTATYLMFGAIARLCDRSTPNNKTVWACFALMTLFNALLLSFFAYGLVKDAIRFASGGKRRRIADADTSVPTATATGSVSAHALATKEE
eukprot:Opistho-2@50935